MGRAPAYEELPTPDAEAYRRIADLVYRHTGIRLGPGKKYFVVGRLGGLYRSLGCMSWGGLSTRLEAAEPPLIETLIQAVVTSETRFFRDDLPFRALVEKIVPEVTAGRPRPAPLRVWSAGCSTGQEPYSIVMALWEALERGDVELEVLATDICCTALERARRGEYQPFELNRGLPTEERWKFFEELGGGAARVREEIRQRVQFDRLNLLADRPRRRTFHVVLCRNVAIYFDRAGKDHLYRTIGSSVVPGGYAVLGAAETLYPGMPEFETVYFERSLLFRKVPGDAR